MIEDFIETNKLNAQIVSFSTTTPTIALIKNKVYNPKVFVELHLFISKNQDEIITITPFGKKPDNEKIETIFGSELLEANENECFELTGYKKNFLSAVSIYGVKIMVDSSLEGLNFLLMPVSEKSFLKIPLEEIFFNNEDVSFEKLI